MEFPFEEKKTNDKEKDHIEVVESEIRKSFKDYKFGLSRKQKVGSLHYPEYKQRFIERLKAEKRYD